MLVDGPEGVALVDRDYPPRSIADDGPRRDRRPRPSHRPTSRTLVPHLFQSTGTETREGSFPA